MVQTLSYSLVMGYFRDTPHFFPLLFLNGIIFSLCSQSEWCWFIIFFF